MLYYKIFVIILFLSTMLTISNISMKRLQVLGGSRMTYKKEFILNHKYLFILEILSLAFFIFTLVNSFIFPGQIQDQLSFASVSSTTYSALNWSVVMFLRHVVYYVENKK